MAYARLGAYSTFEECVDNSSLFQSFRFGCWFRATVPMISQPHRASRAPMEEFFALLPMGPALVDLCDPSDVPVAARLNQQPCLEFSRTVDWGASRSST